MVTSPNWMAPFHSARATAGPRTSPSNLAVPARGHDRLRMISRGRNPPASRERAPMSTQDDERVHVDPSVPGRTNLDRVRADGREELREADDPAHSRGGAEGDRPVVGAVDVDRRAATGRP